MIEMPFLTFYLAQIFTLHQLTGHPGNQVTMALRKKSFLKGPGGVPMSIMSFGDTGSLKHISVGLIEIVAR